MVDGQEDNQRSGGCGCSRASKKPKFPKPPPQRGLGVAQLEKILRNQQQNTIQDTDNKAAFGGRPSEVIHSPFVPPPLATMLPLPVTMSPLTTSTPMSNLASSNSITRNVPSMQNYDRLNPPFPMTTVTGSHSSGSGSGGVYEIGGPAETLPGHGKFRTTWNFGVSNFTREIPKLNSGIHPSMHFVHKMYPNWSSSSLLQSKHIQNPSPLVNVYKSSAISLSPSLSSSSSSSSKLYHHLEHPSNQRSANYSSTTSSEEEKMGGIKRRWPFPVDDKQSPFSSQKLHPCFPSKNKPDTLSSCRCRSKISSEPRKEKSGILKDAKKGKQTKVKPKRSFRADQNLDANSLKSGPPATLSKSTQTSPSELDFHQFKGNIDDPQQLSGQGGSSHQKPFHCFFPPKEQDGGVQTNSSLDNRKGKAEGDSVDLNLNLSLGGSSKH